MFVNKLKQTARRPPLEKKNKKHLEAREKKHSISVLLGAFT
jgi:hypothetical protein